MVTRSVIEQMYNDAGLISEDLLERLKTFVETKEAKIWYSNTDIMEHRRIENLMMIKMLHNAGYRGITYEPQTRTIYAEDWVDTTIKTTENA